MLDECLFDLIDRWKERAERLKTRDADKEAAVLAKCVRELRKAMREDTDAEIIALFGGGSKPALASRC